MIPYALIVDEFLDKETFEKVQHFAVTADYERVKNPVDTINYPDVIVMQDDIGIGERLSRVMGSMVAIKLLVLRRSMRGTPCPEQAHSDISIADSTFSAILYLNKEEHCQGGTSLLRHIKSGSQNGHQEGWQQDKNKAVAWERMLHARMEPNRLFISPSELIHRSEPIGGFGDTAEDARIVLVCLFDLVRA